MSTSYVHYLNVRAGDCSIIQHLSGRVTVIDVCSANPTTALAARANVAGVEMFMQDLAMSSGALSKKKSPAGEKLETATRVALGAGHEQWKCPVDPVQYIEDREIPDIFRYIQTHPDMDHMDGIEALFKKFPPINFWDTGNNKDMSISNWPDHRYSPDDWKYYKKLRCGDLSKGGRSSNEKSDPGDSTNVLGESIRIRPSGISSRHPGPEAKIRCGPPKRLEYLSGHTGECFNKGDDGGDGLHILAPTSGLVDLANKDGDDYNDCSYVILYQCGKNRIVFAGDSHNKTWEHILRDHKCRVSNIDLLIAPHHGRDSCRAWEFLDITKPKLTFFGNAPAKDLAFSKWDERKLKYITNDQANCMIVDAKSRPMRVYVTNKAFAEEKTRNPRHDEKLDAWFVGTILEV